MKRRHLIPLLLTAALLPTLPACCLFISHDEAAATPARTATLEQQLRRDVGSLCAHPRYGASIAHAREHIMAELRAAGWEPELQTFTVRQDGDSGPAETRCNITARREGTATRERYVIGAHYDACGAGGDNPGADDNASAVAALLAIARLLPAAAPQVGLELVFYDCEEPPWFNSGSMGSAVHAARCTPESVRGMVCLEMLGYYSDEEGSQPALFPGYGLVLPTVGNFIAVVGDMDAWSFARQALRHLRQDMPALRVNLPFVHDTALFFSDHRNYVPRGIPAIMVTDTALLRNPNYHEATDTPDTLDYGRMARVTRSLVRFIRELAYNEGKKSLSPTPNVVE